MSYVDLKHLLANLALEAVRDPDRAAWAAVCAAYATLAKPDDPIVSWNTLRRTAEPLCVRFGWQLRPNDAGLLVARGLLDVGEQTVALRPQFAPFIGYLARQSSRLLEALWTIKTLGGGMDDFRRGVALFNAGLYFECHEMLEGVWKATAGSDKTFYHGIVQIAAAFYHHEKRNRHGARTLLTKGLQKLAAYPDRHLGVDLEAFRRTLQPWAEHFSAGAPAPVGALPRISVAEGP